MEVIIYSVYSIVIEGSEMAVRRSTLLIPAITTVVTITKAREEEKIAAVLYCISKDAHTIRTCRDCATNYALVSERTVNTILRILCYQYGLVRFDTKLRRWIKTHSLPKFKSFGDALLYVITRRMKL